MCFDVWSPIVSFASALEGSSLPGKIHTTKDVYELLAADFEFEPRKLVEVKGKGSLNTFFVIKKV